MPNKLEEPAEPSLEASLRALRLRYLSTMKELLGPIEVTLRHCEDGTLQDCDRHELRSMAHRLAGTGETYGFPAVSAAARPLDDQLKSHPHMKAAALMQLIYPLVVACRNALGRDEIKGARPDRVSFGRRNTAMEPVTDVKVRLPLMLVVDDDPAMRDLFTELFRHEARILTATNSDEALAAMRRHSPDLVLLDDIMPGAITGLKFLETLKKTGEFADTSIVMITASDAPEHIDRGLNAGAADYITKPFDPAEVAVKVRRLLRAFTNY
ncbi:MAG: response regulator [Asticcacaulis sp.]|uniref:response regulator n=1 Tax=Asticcacaulis sp. TaxID=1872648 RepID=UPI0039E24F02